MNDARMDREPAPAGADIYTRACLTVIAVLLAVLAAGVWSGPDRPGAPAEAMAQPVLAVPREGGALPDAAAQRAQMVVLLREIKTELGRIHTSLLEGQVKVEVLRTETTNEVTAYETPSRP